MISLAPKNEPGRALELERMVDQYGDSLLRMAFLYLRDIALAQDAVQETFLRVFKHPGKHGETIANERAWVTRIAANVCNDMLRAARRQRIDAGASLESIPAPGSLEQSVDPSVARAVLELPEKLRAVVLLHYYEDLPLAETADALGIGLSAAKTRLSRARAQLKAKLKGWYFDE